MRNDETFLGYSKYEKTLIILIPMTLGGLIGWFIPVIAGWLLKLPIVPMERLIEIIASSESLWFTITAAIIGIIAGIVLAFIIFQENLEIKISDHQLRLKLDNKVDTFDKQDISAIYMENKQFIILGQKNQEIYRGFLETKKDTVREALNSYQYPWYDEDPFKNKYQRWVLGHPDFPEKINALLHAREHALKEDKKKDAEYLREDLAELGAVIKDEKNGQYVRLAV